MERPNPLAFARVPAVVLVEQENENMVSTWIDYLVVTRTKAGNWGVYARKWGEDYQRGRYIHKWIEVDRQVDIRAPHDLLSAIRRCEDVLCASLPPTELVAGLERLDVAMAQQVAELA